MPPAVPHTRAEEAVTAFDGSSKTWLTAARATPTCAPVPALAGTLWASAPRLREAADDFGHVVSHAPSAVLRPGSAEDIQQMIRFARRHGLKIGPRGQGHAMYGQAQVKAGIVIDMSAMARIHSIADDRVQVDAGTRWSTLVERTLRHGRAPPVLTDYLELSVGGTLSVGGVSGDSFRYGTQLEHVVELEVVTGQGERVNCSPSHNRDLFDAMLAGLGQCGVITRATLRLIPAPARLRVYDLFYAELGPLLRDIRLVIGDGRFQYVHGFALPHPQGGGWLYGLRGLAHDGSPEADGRLQEGLSHLRGAEQISTQRYLDFCMRMGPQMAELQRMGRYADAHPWCDLLVPDSRLEELMSEALREVALAEISHYFPVLMYPFKRQRLTRPLFRVPAEDTFFLLDILRTAGPGTRDGAKLVAHNRKLFERNRAMGGTHYVISALERSAEDWKQHYGPAWADFAAAKRRYDPDNVLTPGPGIFR